MRTILMMCLMVAGSAWAGDYDPYPPGKISVSQWQSYYKGISAKSAYAKNEVAVEKLITFSDDAGGKQYVFTQKGNPAHPAALAREILFAKDEVKVKEIGYFAGNEAEFNNLYENFKRHNRQLEINLTAYMKEPPSPSR